MFALMPAAMIHTYHLVSLLFFSLPEAIAQAQSQLLLGSCNFESSTCGYMSDGEFTSWSLHKDGIGKLFFPLFVFRTVDFITLLNGVLSSLWSW